MKQIAIFFLLASVAISCKKNTAPPTDTSKTFKITATSGTGGSIDPPGVTKVVPGWSPAYTIIPNTGYGILTLTVDNVAITPVHNIYTFTNVQADHTINATFAPAVTLYVIVGNGTATVSPDLLLAGTSATITIKPNSTFRTDSLYINGVFTKLLSGATTYSVSNITANEQIRITCTDVLTKLQVDSLSNLLISQWTMVQLDGKLGNLQDTVLPWENQPLGGCTVNQFDQFFSNGVFQRNNNPAACDPSGAEQFRPRPLNHWKLKNNGKVIYLTDPPLDSLTNVTLTKDSLIVFFYGGFDPVRGISYKYHYARKQ